MGIPKIIHYCWFGKGKKNKLIQNCIESWKKYMPDYEVKEWNEENFDVNSNEYVKEAYNMKKYAFVSDYVRLKALHEFGGIYFDTDIEVLKNFDTILTNKDIYCFEMPDQIMTGVMISQKKSGIIFEYLKHYDKLKFKNEDGTPNLIPNTKFFTSLLISKGLVLNNKRQIIENNIEIFPNEYFCAYDMQNCRFEITKNTYTVHHYTGSWNDGKKKVRKNIKRFFSKILGKKLYEKIRLIKKKIIKKK